MQNESLQSIIENLKKELEDKSRQLEDANKRASNLQKRLAENVDETSSNEVKFAEVWKENKILRRVIAKETEEVHSIYEKCVNVIQKYQELEAQYKQVLSILLNADPSTSSQGFIAKLQKENEEKKVALEEITAKLTNRENEYTTLKNQYEQVKEELDNLKSSDPELNDKAKLLEEIAKLKEIVKDKESKINSLTQEKADLQTKLAIGKYDEQPQALDDFINNSLTEHSEAEELEAKYEEAKGKRVSNIESSSKPPAINMTEIITEANTPREKALLLRIAELESQLNELKNRAGLDIVPTNQNNDGKPWTIVTSDEKPKVQERGIKLQNIQNLEEEEEVDPNNLPNVNVSAINSPKTDEQHQFASDDNIANNKNDLESESELDSEYETLLSNENVPNKRLITKLMAEVRKLRKELHKDQAERRELVESLRQSGSIMVSAPQSPKGNLQNQDEDNFTSNEIETETETDNNDERAADRLQIVSRVVQIAEENGDHQTDQLETETETDENRYESEARQQEEEREQQEAQELQEKEAEELAALLDQPPAENLEEANTRIKLLEDKIKELCDQINNLQFQESSLNISGMNPNDNPISQDFQAALKRISKLQKKLDDRSKPPENMQQFEDEISRLRTELQESSNHAKELQDLLDSFSSTTNSGVVEVVKENQSMKKTIERKDKEIEDATKKGADILAKYNEQQNTIKSLIDDLKSTKSKNNELTRTNAELLAQNEQLQKELDQAYDDADASREDLSKLDEITSKYFLNQTELEVTKIKLDKAMMLLKTKGGPKALYAFEVYDQIVDMKREIQAQQELLHNIETVLNLQPDSLVNLVDKENYPKPQPENESNETENNTEKENDEERNKKNIEAVKNLLSGVSTGSKNWKAEEPSHLLLFESDNDFFNHCDKLTADYENLTKETERMRTILTQVEEELHLQPGHLTNRQIDNELDVEDGQSDRKKLPSGWLNQIVSECNGSGFTVKTRAVKLSGDDEEDEEEDSDKEKEKEIERLNNVSINKQTQVMELEAICEGLRRQILTLNNKLSLMDTDRQAALQNNTILKDKCTDLQRKITRLNNKLKARNQNGTMNLNNSLSMSVSDIKNE